jgi:hypothetical protein
VFIVVLFALSCFANFGLHVAEKPSQDLLLNLAGVEGSFFRSSMNPISKTPHKVLCSFPLDYQDNSESVESATRDFIIRHPQLFSGVRESDLFVIKLTKVLDRWIVIYGQSYQGIEILNARADFRLQNGRIVMLGSDVYSVKNLDITNRLEAKDAIEIASNTFKTGSYSATLNILSGNEFRLVWLVKGDLYSPRSKPVVLIDAHEGTILEHYDDIRYDVSGTVEGEYIPHLPSDGTVFGAFSNLIVGSDLGYMDTTDYEGNYTLPVTPDGTPVLFESHQGKNAVITNVLRESGASAFFIDSDPFDVSLAYGDFQYQELNAYYHVNYIHTWLKTFDEDFTYLDYQMPIFVRDTVSPTPINAFWDGRGIHMGAGGSGWDDFSYYSEIFYHEYTHGITHSIYIGSTLPYTGQSGAIDGALSDYFACMLTGDPEVGEGGLLPGGGPMRTLDNTKRFPEDWEDEVHADGEIMGGAFWDLRRSMRSSWSDSLIHFARYGLPNTFDDYAWEILSLDDDDGDLRNGTPNLLGIYEAFTAHGIGNFEASIVHTPFHDTEDSLNPYIITARIISVFPIDLSETRLYYSTYGDRFTAIHFTLGDDGLYRAEIPAQPWETVVSYYIEAFDSAGTSDIIPNGAPETLFSFRVGRDITAPSLTHSPLDDQPEGRHPYLLYARSTDNYAVSWIRLIYSKNSLSADTVLMEYVMDDLYSGRISLGSVLVGDTVHYKLESFDVAEESNVTHLPSSGMYHFIIVRSIFLDFEGGTGGLVSSSGWEWGEPTFGPSGVTSGSKCWGTVLDGYYDDNVEYLLTTGEFDAVSYTACDFEFSHWYEIEARYDGGIVQFSTDGGRNWAPIPPPEGYPRNVYALGERGFTGSSNGFWRTVRFDLTPYLGNSFRFRFVFKSDPGVTDAGWFIDDVCVLEKQILLPVTSLAAARGYDNRVLVSWIGPYSGLLRPYVSFEFSGYNVYRSLSGSERGDLIASLDERDAFYEDTDVENETTYYYRVSARYDRGESDLCGPVAATPFNAIISVDPPSFDVVLMEDATLDTFMTVSNLGDGNLSIAISELSREPSYRSSGEPDLSRGLAMIRDAIAYYSSTIIESMPTIDPTGEWRLLATDPDEPGDDLDLRDLYSQHTSTDLYFKVRAWAPMGDPTSDFSVGFMLNTDLNPLTGMAEAGGAEYIVAIGNLPMGRGMILRYNPDSPYGFDMAGTPHWIYLPSGGDSVGCGFTRASVGNPTEMDMMVAVMRNIMSSTTTDDIMPDGGVLYYSFENLDWLSETPVVRDGILSGSPLRVDLLFNAEPAGRGEHNLWLKIDSNDRTNPETYIPVRMHVWGEAVHENSVPDALSCVTVSPNPFNNSCYIEFPNPSGSQVLITITDTQGREIFKDNIKNPTAGMNGFTWQPEAVSGVYNIRIETTKGVFSRKLVLVR